MRPRFFSLLCAYSRANSSLLNAPLPWCVTSHPNHTVHDTRLRRIKIVPVSHSSLPAALFSLRLAVLAAWQARRVPGCGH